MKKLHVVTYGCQMNVRDGEEVTGLLLERGYALIESEVTHLRMKRLRGIIAS